MTVRVAGPDDHEEIRELLAAAYAQYAGAVSVRALFDHYLADVLDLGGTGGGVSLLAAESGGRIAGTARLYAADTLPFLPAGWTWVRAVGVHPQVRRAGVARELMADCLRRAKEAGAAVLSLHTMAFMPGAVRLYERLGYRRAPEQDIDVAGHYGVGGDMDALAYRLDLRS